MKKLLSRIQTFLNDIETYIFFNKKYGSFKGVYKDFEEANSKLPINTKKGYNNLDSAERLLNFVEESKKQIFEHEYPPFFWLNNIINGCNKTNIKIFDFGGAYGWHFFKIAKYSKNNNFSWTVYDVEEIIKIAKDKFEGDRLKFTTNFEEVNNSDIFFSSGAIQYAEEFSLSISLSQLQAKPKHILLSRLPMQDSVKQFVTLQNASSSFNPQYVFNRKDFISSLENIGYELVDTWRGYDSCHIPFHKNKSIQFYTGFYFKLKEILQ